MRHASLMRPFHIYIVYLNLFQKHETKTCEIRRSIEFFRLLGCYAALTTQKTEELISTAAEA